MRLLRQSLIEGRDTPRTALIGGDPGIGKSRLAATAAQSAFAEGATVLWGRCDEHLTLPFQPFADALRPFVPNFAELIGFDSESPRGGLSWDLARERLLEIVTDLVRRVAIARPVVLIIDDVHWASETSVELLRHLIRTEPDVALTTLVTYNAAELADSPFVAHLDHFAARTDVAHFVLNGLLESEVEALLALRTDVIGREQLAKSLCRETGGNPFFIGEIIQAIVDGTGIVTTQGSSAKGVLRERIQAILNQRLARRSPSVRRLLPAAATLGLAFDVRVLVQMFAEQLPESEVIEGLEEARAAHLIEELGPLHFRFVHNLIRRAVLGQLTETQQALLHRSAADALETVHGEHLSSTPAALAHHLFAAGPSAPLARRIDAILEAAAQCVAQFDREGAKRYTTMGLLLLERAGIDDPGRRCDLLLLGGSLSMAGDQQQLDWIRRAADDAERIGDHDRLATAVALFGDHVTVGESNDDAIDLCTRCLEVLSPDDDLNRARVLAVLIFNLAWSGRGGAQLQRRLERLSAEATERIDGCDDSEVRWRVYDAHSAALHGSSDLGLRLRIADQAVSPNTNSSWHKALILIAGGDRSAFEASVAAHAASRSYWDIAVASEWCAMLALADGRWDDASSYAAKALADVHDDSNFETVYMFQMAVLLWETGRLSEIVDTIAEAADSGYAPAVGTLGLAYAECGDYEKARGPLARLVGLLDDAARDFTWTATLAITIELGARLHEPEAVAAAEALLRPFAGQLIIAATGTHIHGAVDRFLAIARMAAGERDEAQRLFASAMELEERVGALALSLRTRMWQARALLGSGVAEQCAEGERLRAEVLRRADALGQYGLRTLADEAASPAEG